MALTESHQVSSRMAWNCGEAVAQGPHCCPGALRLTAVTQEGLQLFFLEVSVAGVPRGSVVRSCGALHQQAAMETAASKFLRLLLWLLGQLLPGALLRCSDPKGTWPRPLWLQPLATALRTSQYTALTCRRVQASLVLVEQRYSK